jgi:hypothetical protein
MAREAGLPQVSKTEHQKESEQCQKLSERWTEIVKSSRTLLPTPNRGSLNTFAGQGFPINWLAPFESQKNLQFFKESKKEADAVPFKDGQNST